MTAFSDLPLPAHLLKAVAVLGYSGMTAIQASALPPMLAGADVLAQAVTGSGKTAAFGLALLAKLQADNSRLQALVLCPTRELADQVSKELRALARFIPNIKIASLCGGVPLRAHLASLVHEPHIVVGTPGRILELIAKKALALDEVHTVVLDEADRMLDMGFLDAMRSILAALPAAHSTWLFSATYPAEIDCLSNEFQREPLSVTVASRHDDSVILQCFHEVDAAGRTAAVAAVLLHRQPACCLVFCNMKQDVRDLTDSLCQRGMSAIALHGDLGQREREEALLQFANGSRRVLVATDVAARGLDIKALPMVIAFELPHDPAVHVHRIGRTGRAGERGLAVSLVAPAEAMRIRPIEQAMGAAAQWSDLPPLVPGISLPPPAMRTLVIDGGRRDKLRPGDILGALTGAAGLPSAQIGAIDLFPTRAYVAIEQAAIGRAIAGLRTGKIKGRNFRVRAL